MKKYLLSVFAMMMALVCVGFVSCGSDDNGGSSPGGQLTGLWYEHDGGYIHAYCFNADGTGWKGEWREGQAEEHRAFTWKVQDNRLLTYSVNDGDLMDDLAFSISVDGKTLTLTKPSTGKVKGVFTRQ